MLPVNFWVAVSAQFPLTVNKVFHSPQPESKYTASIRCSRCQAKFLTSWHVHMHRVILYISNTQRKLMIRA